MSCYDNILSQVGEVRASVMDTVMDHMMDLDTLDTGEEADNGDDMDEMNMPNPGKWDIKYLLSLESSPQQYLIICNIIFSGSIEHFEKLFYPKIPCKNCSTCYENFSDEIKWL